jgi:hypothetical protein
MNDKISEKQNRRQFLKLLSAGSFVCFGCGHLCALPGAQKTSVSADKHKFLQDSRMSFEDVFKFTYQRIVNIMKNLADKIGNEKLLEMLKEASDNMAKQMPQTLPEGKNDLAAFTAPIRNPNYFWNHVTTVEIARDTPTDFEVRVKECLWAKTFRDLDAADIGYAMVCHGDFAAARAFNPKLRMTRTKTLMEDHEHCNHHWIMEG